MTETTNPPRRQRLWLWIGAAVAVTSVAALVVYIATPSRGQVATAPADEPEPGVPWFVDVTAAAGIDFVHFDPATEFHYIQETIGSGLAWIDYDNDGWPDLFCVQDGPVRAAPGGPRPTNRLYRNNRDGTFTNVTERAKLARAGFGQGCAVGDFDNDGFDDLVVTYLGEIVLYRNNGDGTFADVTAAAKLHNPHWGTSCAWGDVDGDGFLDLYVCNYVEVDIDRYPVCEKDGRRFVCPPTSFAHTAHRLYRNNGNGTFTDVSAGSGVAVAAPAPGLGVVMTDLDGDGRLDVYVANDLKPQYLFHNQGGGRFVEKGVLSGCGLGPTGRPISGMGVEAGDIDGSGRPALFVTNFHNEPNVLFRNLGRLRFLESGMEAGLAFPSIDRLGFGTVFVDADLDGWLDVAVANGHIHRLAEEVYRAPYAQLAQLFVGDGRGHFRDVSDRAGGYFREKRVGRGLAVADFDNDGRPDLAFSHCGGPPTLLHNRTRTDNGWLGLELVGDGKRSNRNAVGARVEVETDGGTQVRFVNGGGSYLSASERRLLVGLAAADRAPRVTVRWPSGREQVFADVPGRRWWRLSEGKDQPEPVPYAAAGPRRAAPYSMKLAILTALVSFATGAGLVRVALFPKSPARNESNAAGQPPEPVERETPRSMAGTLPRGRQETTYGDAAPAGTPFEGVEVELTGYQDHWQVGYRGPGGGDTARPVWPDMHQAPDGTSLVRLPADSNVRLKLTSRDFVYMLSLPRLNRSQVAVPGREFRLEFRSHSPGVFVLPGDHVCGPAKPSLNLTVYVDPKPEFEAWLEELTRARDRPKGIKP